jgi:polysaccharide export outer membrane protein
MHELFSWFPSDGFARFAFDAAWQSTLCVVIALVVLHWTRQPALRAGIALIAVALTLVLPVASWTVRGMGVSAIVVNAPIVAARPAVLRNDVDAVPMEKHPRAVGVHAPEHAMEAPWNWREWFAFAVPIAWASATALLLARLALSALTVRRWLRRATPCDDADWQTALQRAATKLQVAAPRVAFSEDVASPTMVPYFRPTLLLPIALRTHVSQVPAAERLSIVCAHELAHLRRRDGWAMLFLECGAALLPWQPGVWRLKRVFAAAAEDACDDWAVSTGAHPVTIAAVLTELVPTLPPSGIGVAMMTTDAKTRILRLLALREPTAPNATRRAKFFVATIAAVLAAAIALTQPVTAEQQDPDSQPTETTVEKKNEADAPEEIAVEIAPEYVIEPPDVLLIDSVYLVPKAPHKIGALDMLFIQGSGLLPESPLADNFAVEPGGRVNLGASYGSVDLNGLSMEEAQEAIVEHLQKKIGIRAPEISVTLKGSKGDQQINGEHLVGPDGRVVLGSYGTVFVAGKTIQQARDAVEKHLSKYFDEAPVSIDVYKYNSKFYYILLEDKITGGEVIRMPITGNETVLDAIAVANEQGASRLGTQTEIWVARRPSDPNADYEVLPVDYKKIFRGQNAATNYRLRPQDRVFLSRTVKPERETEQPEKKGDAR